MTTVGYVIILQHWIMIVDRPRVRLMYKYHTNGNLEYWNNIIEREINSLCLSVQKDSTKGA